MRAEVKDNFAFAIPKKIQENLKLKPKNVVEVFIKGKLLEGSFITFVRCDNRILVRSSARRKLKISKGDIIKIKIKNLKEISRSKVAIKENKIDLLSLIPEKSRKGFPIKVFENSGKLVICEDVKRGHFADPLIINRFASFDFYKFLGLIQAEGEKGLNWEGGNALTFTNINIKLLESVVKTINELLVNQNLIVIRALVPKGTSKNKCNKKINELLSATNLQIAKVRISILEKKKYTYDKNEGRFKIILIKNVAFTIKVERTLFNELILNSINILRNFLCKKKKFNEFEEKAACNFLSGIVMGDGTIGIGSDERNRQKCFFEIKDEDVLNLRECEKIFNTLTFTTKLYEKSFPPKLVVRTNWNNLFFIAFKNKMFIDNEKQWGNLLKTITSRKQFRSDTNYI